MCGKKTGAMICPDCGFDPSRDYERYPTLTSVKKVPAISGLRNKWQSREIVSEVKKVNENKKKVWPIIALLSASVASASLFILSRPTIVGTTPSLEDLENNLIDGYSAVGYYEVSTKIPIGMEAKVEFDVGEAYNGCDVLITGDKKDQPVSAVVSNGIVTAKLEPKGNYLLQVKTNMTDGLNWSEWSEKLPAGIDINSDTVQTDIMYRTRQKVYTTANEDVLDGWILYESFVPETPYGEWSEWTESKLTGSEMQEIEEMKMYRSREKEFTSSTSPTMAGWTHYSTKEDYIYGAWCEWSTTPMTPSSTLEVESITTYMYVFNVYVDDSYSHTESLEFYYDPGMKAGSVFDEGDVGGEYYKWIVASITERKQYKSRTKTLNSVTYYFYRWSDWTDWGTEHKEENGTVEVEEKSVYRVRDIYGDVGYRFWKWSDWGELTQERPAEEQDREVENCRVYRYCS